MTPFQPGHTIRRTKRPQVPGLPEKPKGAANHNGNHHILKRLEAIPSSCRGIYLRAVRGKSRRAAIQAMCLECMGWQRDEIGKCTAPACPLYLYRPYQEAKL